jgi:hypothetical protein
MVLEEMFFAEGAVSLINDLLNYIGIIRTLFYRCVLQVDLLITHSWLFEAYHACTYARRPPG